jgi:hypothetical protein
VPGPAVGLEGTKICRNTNYRPLSQSLKECLAFTRALTLAEPDNPDAGALQAALRSDMQRDLNDARALIEDSSNKLHPEKFRKAAEIILLKALYVDPEHQEAKVLLQTVRAVS